LPSLLAQTRHAGGFMRAGRFATLPPWAQDESTAATTATPQNPTATRSASSARVAVGAHWCRSTDSDTSTATCGHWWNGRSSVRRAVCAMCHCGCLRRAPRPTLGRGSRVRGFDAARAMPPRGSFVGQQVVAAHWFRPTLFFSVDKVINRQGRLWWRRWRRIRLAPRPPLRRARRRRRPNPTAAAFPNRTA
jgi:hypothetical protein